MQNIKDLRNDLVENFELLKNKKIDLKQASEMANHAGKILNTIALELKYQDMTGDKKKIDFLEYDNDKENKQDKRF